ncbi:39S ribosomal protein L14, mitochondrial-like [Lingula anatina]|uniref:Large ribosomal subunit protein uL14m n=1 Tax=Lingula anatina TaxID=7574 RepID=A0A1S3K7D6_LINAN|nr:39S ribosomal protein L14, mitochondrial-like [Lingula anatina]|eukprot:XP_013418407.1 39S ribosomal protein L14, mitochondrial-like [Lingula anatina]
MSAVARYFHSRAVTLGLCTRNNTRHFSTSLPLCELRHMSRVNVVDNSDLGKNAKTSGKPARIVHVYNKQGVARIGDKVLLALEKQKVKGIIVGCKQKQKHMIPKFDSNNVVLIDEEDTPMGSRINVPIPSVLRKKEELAKILAISSRFV